MKLTKWIFYFVLFLLTTSAVSKDTTPGLGLSEGSTMPDMVLLSSGAQPCSLGSYRGKMVLLQFWTSSDASSRIANVQMSNLLKSSGNQSVKMVSVSFDTSSEVALMTGKMDGLSEDELFTVNHVLKEQTMRRFRINSRHYGNFLLNEEGVIIGRNLSTETLKHTLRL